MYRKTQRNNKNVLRVAKRSFELRSDEELAALCSSWDGKGHTALSCGKTGEELQTLVKGENSRENTRSSLKKRLQHLRAEVMAKFVTHIERETLKATEDGVIVELTEEGLVYKEINRGFQRAACKCGRTLKQFVQDRFPS